MDWHKDPLSPGTVIDRSFRTTANVRRFFAAELGGGPVHFTRPFLLWMKAHRGSSLADAVGEYRRGRQLKTKGIVCK